jgi:hypothetical protein
MPAVSPIAWRREPLGFWRGCREVAVRRQSPLDCGVRSGKFAFQFIIARVPRLTSHIADPTTTGIATTLTSVTRNTLLSGSM